MYTQNITTDLQANMVEDIHFFLWRTLL